MGHNMAQSTKVNKQSNTTKLDSSSLTQSMNLSAPQKPIGKEFKRDSSLKGIYGFFGSQELPPNPKHASITDIPNGLEAIPFIIQNKCYAQGAELMN